MKILFMCVANSARSQMAEGLARSLFPSHFEIQSAGSEPRFVHPMAIKVLSEIDINIMSHSSKSWDQLAFDFRENLDLLITLCAEEVCPIVNFKPIKKLHWPLHDPAVSGLTDEDQLQSFRKIRDEIKTKLQKLVAES